MPSPKLCSKLTLIQALTRCGERPIEPARAAVAPQALLGAICFAEQSVLDSQRSAPYARDLAIQYVATPPLGAAAGAGASCLWQMIYTDRTVRRGRAGRIDYCTDGAYVFGVMEVPRVRGRSGDLKGNAQGAYQEIFAFLEALDAERPFNIWRAWNYVSDIHADENDLERYRQFNTGRLNAFMEHWAARSSMENASYAPTREIPASCGVGMVAPSSALDLTVAFLASHLPFTQLENPRQVSAFHYPAEYGPSSPTFSRAILGPAEPPSGPPHCYFLISGTGSIIGHRTVHGGDVAEQTRESLRNIEALLQEANRRQLAPGQRRLALSELQYLVYLRHPGDLPAVQAVLSEVLGPAAKVRVVHAEICRTDLLLEMEASLLWAQDPT